ncbi:hypothetical protein ACWIDS_11495 [Dietzia maris]
MRPSTKIGATLSTAALGAATVLGGAGVAQAQSLGSLGSSAEADLTLELEAATDVAANGTLANNTETDLTCYVGVADEEAIADAAAGAADVEILEAYFAGLSAGVAVTSALAVDAGESAEWAVALDEEADFTAGALAFCEGGEGDDAVETFVVDYEPSGLLGSLNMGSLGS